MNSWKKSFSYFVVTASATAIFGAAFAGNRSPALDSLEGMMLSARVYADGTYSISAPGIAGPVIRSDVEAKVDALVLRSSAYPRHTVERSELPDELGPASTLTITHTGLIGQPDLVCVLKLMQDQPWGEIVVTVHNSTARAISVHAIRSVHATAAPIVDLGAPASFDRILSDSYSEDRPQLAIRGRWPRRPAPCRGQPAHLQPTQRQEPVLRCTHFRAAVDDLSSQRKRRQGRCWHHVVRR